jgi:hypothetical protein
MLSGVLDHADWVIGAVTMATAMVTRAWFRLRSREIRERSKSYRMRIALKDCKPHERAEIILALDGNQQDPPSSAEKKPKAKE